MISNDLKTLSHYFLRQGLDVGIVMEPPACAAMGTAILELASRVEAIEDKPVPAALRNPVTIVPAADYAHLVCKEPPWAPYLKTADVTPITGEPRGGSAGSAES